MRKALKIKVNKVEKTVNAIPPFATKGQNALNINAFSFSRANSAKSVPIGRYLQSMRKNQVFRDVEVKGTVRMYIEYYYRIPESLRPAYGNKEWYRGRYFGGKEGGINRRSKKDPGFPAYLRNQVELALEKGYDPFDYDVELDRTMGLEKALAVPPPSAPSNILKDINLGMAMDNYIAHCRDKNLRKRSIGSYASMVNFMKDHFAGPQGSTIVDLTARLFQPVGLVTRAEIMEFLKETSSEQEWSPSRYNTIGSYATGMFNWFASEDVQYIEKSPISRITQKKTDEKMNMAYTDQQAIIIKKAMLAAGEKGAYVHFFCEFIYYTCLRPVEEARVLQVKNINFQQRTITIPGIISKNRKLYHIPLAADLYDLLKAKGIDKYPSDYYIFSAGHGPAVQPPSKNYFANIFRKIRDQDQVLAAGITPEHTIYSFKHTRACHLVIDGVPLAEIQKLMKHSSLDELESYLRDLGELVSQITSEKARSF